MAGNLGGGDIRGSVQEPLPPDSWPGAAGMRSVAPEVPAWPGAATRAGLGESWPGAVPSGAADSQGDGPITDWPGLSSATPAPVEHPVAWEELQMRAPANRVNPRAKAMWAVAAALGWLFPLLAVAVWAFFDPNHRTWQLWAAGGLALLALADIAIVPQWRFRVHRWEVTDASVYTQTGWFKQDRRLAPISRIQTVDSQFGPIERMFGLGTVTVTTASAAGPLKISGLGRDAVERLVAELTAVTSRTRSDAT